MIFAVVVQTLIFVLVRAVPFVLRFDRCSHAVLAPGAMAVVIVTVLAELASLFTVPALGTVLRGSRRVAHVSLGGFGAGAEDFGRIV